MGWSPGTNFSMKYCLALLADDLHVTVVRVAVSEALALNKNRTAEDLQVVAGEVAGIGPLSKNAVMANLRLMAEYGMAGRERAPLTGTRGGVSYYYYAIEQ